MERFVFRPSQNAYALFGQLERLDFSDDLYRMAPLKRVITAKVNNEILLTATWVNGDQYFSASISGEGSMRFICRIKE
jgi:hypothetical protein